MKIIEKMITKIKRLVVFATIFYCMAINSQAQVVIKHLAKEMNVITTATPFLTIAPDSRGGGMGDVGVATSPDAYSLHWNPAKFAFIKDPMGFSISYTPWLKKLVDDISLSYASGYYRLDQNQVVAFGLRYFSMGSITFTDISGATISDFNPNEFALEGAYSLKLGEKLSAGIGLRYIYSNLTGNAIVNETTATHAGHSVAGDISAYYQNDEIKVFQKPAILAFGMNVSNIGAKVSYTDDADKSFIPTNLKLGSALTFELDEYNSLTVTADVNKLLTPTPPQYVLKNPSDPNSDKIMIGKPSNVSIITGIFQSFSDAPGGFQEEMHEIMYSGGIEYWYAKQFALRSGYFHEHETKGDRKYFTFGLGLKLNILSINFSYLMPTTQQNPLENTLRFSLLFDFSAKEKNKIAK
jgi:hypothetical protein